MMPSAEQHEQIQMAQRAQRKLAQGFQMYTYFIATGTPIPEAISKMEAAMDTWTDYEDAHMVEMPMPPDIVAQMMAKFGEAMDSMMAQKRERKSKRNYETGNLRR